MGKTTIFEPLATECGPLLATNAAMCHHTFLVAVVNPTEDDYWLRLRLGVLKPAYVLPAGGDRVDMRVHEIVIGVTPEQSSSKESVGGTDDIWSICRTSSASAMSNVK